MCYFSLHIYFEQYFVRTETDVNLLFLQNEYTSYKGMFAQATLGLWLFPLVPTWFLPNRCDLYLNRSKRVSVHD